MTMIHYFAENTEVLLGDKVKLRNFFRWKYGVISHVPGISRHRHDFDGGDIQEVGVTTINDGYIYGIGINPETKRVFKQVKYIERGPIPEPIPDIIDDEYIEND